MKTNDFRINDMILIDGGTQSPSSIDLLKSSKGDAFMEVKEIIENELIRNFEDELNNKEIVPVVFLFEKQECQKKIGCWLPVPSLSLQYFD